jgi:hypothetical protein
MSKQSLLAFALGLAISLRLAIWLQQVWSMEIKLRLKKEKFAYAWRETFSFCGGVRRVIWWKWR